MGFRQGRKCTRFFGGLSVEIICIHVIIRCMYMYMWIFFWMQASCIYGCGSKCKVWIKPRSHTRSRPPIQTSDPDLSKGFDPDLWSRPLEWYNVLVSWCLVQWWLHVIGFPALLLFTLPSSQATNCCEATLPSCTCRKVTLLSSQAVQQPSCNCCTSKLSNCQADTVASCKASLPSSQAAHLLPAHLVVLFLPCCIQAATYTNNVSPLLGRSRPGSRPIQTRSRPQPQPAPTQTTSSSVLKLVIVWFLSLLQTLGSQSINFGTHVNGTKSAYSQVESEVWTL